jgi:(2Fe-2S) ferredoxin
MPRANRQGAMMRVCKRICFFLVHVEGGFYGLIQFLDLARIARAH